jgi:hypothetical protein
MTSQVSPVRTLVIVPFAAVVLVVAVLLTGGRPAEANGSGAGEMPIPPAWEILPTPRYVDYDAPDPYLVLGDVALVRREGSPYQTVRDETGELTGNSTIIEEELVAVLREKGADNIAVHTDDLTSCEGYDTLILLGMPEHNAVSRHYFEAMGLGFDRWDDANTEEDDFTGWRDLGAEGYVLKVGRAEGRNIVLMAGYDRDDARGVFYGAGTFYALQSFRQLLGAKEGVVHVKTAEVADAPLVRYRGCMSGFDPSEEQEWRNIELMPRIKANLNVYWYGNALAGYNAEATVRFRYPWRPDQLDCFRRVGQYCRERFVTMVFCMNPDHYGVEWAAPKTFDGSAKDPLHYDPAYRVEPEFRQMWADLGYEVENDIDILAAKFAQLQEAVPGAMLQMMNEDDGFGLIHEADTQRFSTATGDPRQDAVNYGKARAELLAALHKRIKEQCPDSPDVMPLCPPGQLAYQHVLDRDEAYSRPFLTAFGETLREMGLADAFPILTTGGGTAAEVLTGQSIDNFKTWAAGAPVQLHDNNFAYGFHVGAYETDPSGPRAPGQLNAGLPAGYRDKHLYSRLWGIVWNGLNDQHVLAWCQTEFMWNMLALERAKVNALATRKVCTEEAYPLVKSFYEEFDGAASYLPDCQPPYRLLAVSDRVVFPSNAWTYDLSYSDEIWRECERLRDTLARLIPQLDAQWASPFEKAKSLDAFGHVPLAFCSVYLAYGSIEGWPSESATDRIEGRELRDLYLEADDIQERYFAGPEEVPGHCRVLHSFYMDKLRYIYTDGAFKSAPKSAAEADRYVDIWNAGLEERFFQPLVAAKPGELSDTDASLVNGWGPVEEKDGETARVVGDQAVLALDIPKDTQILVRLRVGTDAAGPTDATPITLAFGEIMNQDAVCQPRWLNWLVPDGVHADCLTIRVAKPVRVYAIHVYRATLDLPSQ